MKQNIIIFLIALFYIIISATIIKATDLEDLAKEGYAVFEETEVDGEFEGCDQWQTYSINKWFNICLQ
jgi:hypothetical protein